MKVSLARAALVQIYLSLIGILLMPVYLRYLGGEAFGLVGFSIMLQAWIQLLDLGMSPVLAREMSRYRAGSVSRNEISAKLNALEMATGGAGLVVALLLVVSSDWIARSWLSVNGISKGELATCVALIGLSGVLAWLSGMYRSCLSGLERQKLFNGLNVALATIRYVGVVPVLVYVSDAPVIFFAYQAGAGVLSVLLFSSAVRRCVTHRASFQWHKPALLSMLPMVGSMAFLSIAWVAITQIDKLILSGLLPLEAYGYFMLASMAAGGVMILIPPLNQVVQPRLTILAERKDDVQLILLYRLSMQIFVVAFLALGGVVAFFAKPILLVWVGSPEVAADAAPILFWYALANSLTGVLVLPFMLQFAKGQLRFQVISNVVMLATLVPSLVFAALHWGAVGTGSVQFLGNLLFFSLWIPVVHRKILPALSWKRMVSDAWVPGAVVLLSLFACAKLFVPFLIGKTLSVFLIGIAFILAVVLGVASGSLARSFVVDFLRGAIK